MYPPDIEEIVRRLDEHRAEVVRDTGMSTVALFAVFHSSQGDHLELAGTGTLVTVGSFRYILTAAHVWQEILKSAVKIGITLSVDLDHRYLIDVNTIVPFGPPRPSTWNEWGPDLIFLRIPPEHVGTISAYRVFENLAIEHPPPKTNHVKMRILMGTPKVLGEFTKTHAQIQIAGFFFNDVPKRQTQGDFDYLDLRVDVSCPDTPESFGGVSGGGLWKVLVHASPSPGRVESIATLEGVAFYASAIENGRRILRCHGPESIRTAMPPS